MKPLGMRLVIAALVVLFSSASIHSFDFGPRPLFAFMQFDHDRSIYMMYSYQYIAFNALTAGEQPVEGRGVETTDVTDSFQPHHSLTLSTDLLFGVDTALGYMTNRFNEQQEDSIPYDEVTAELRQPVEGVEGAMAGRTSYWYARYRRVSQDVSTNYRVRSGVYSSTVETLDYPARLDFVKLGGLATQDITGSGMDLGEIYMGLTYVRLSTSIPGFAEGGELASESLSGDSLGLAFAGSASVMQPFTEPRVFSPYLTLGYAATFFGVSRMNDSWATGVSFGPSVQAGEGIFDGSFELGLGMFISDIVRMDANAYFNGVVINKNDYEQILGQGGVGISVEFGI